MTHFPPLPTFPESLWSDSLKDLPSFPKLQQNIEADVAVVGGGIAGITTAFLLIKAGFNVALIEAGKLLTGTTGHTTAKITAQHHLIYDELITQSGKEKAALYYQANEEARQFMESIIAELNIECALQQQDAYIYTTSPDYIEKLQKEMAAYDALGIPGAYVEQIPLNIAALAAVRMDRQAQFHPLQYMTALVKKLSEMGCQIYEQTTAIDIQNDASTKVVSADGHTVTCKHVAICTHYPFYDGLGLYFTRMYADRSYALAIKTDVKYAGGMYITAEEPSRSIRSATALDGTPLLIIGGQTHKTGQGICTINHYEQLQAYAAEQFKASEIVYRWSAQDLVTGDKIPYIGRLTSFTSNIYVATGFKKWGMTTGTLAAKLITDLIQEKSNQYEELFSPTRPMSLKTVTNLVVENLDVAKHLIGGKLEHINRRPEDLADDEGSAVMVNGKRAGAYRDKSGKLFVVDTTCTHMGCETEWNDGERTWDCPCHGSRFSYTGEVMEGPAEKPLKSLVDE